MTRPDPGESGDDRYVVRSVVRAVEVLHALESADSRGLTVTEIARRVGCAKSSAFATLHTLQLSSLVQSSGRAADRRYRLGLALARLGEQATEQNALSQVAEVHLRDLVAATGLTARAAVLDQARAVVVARIDGPGAIRFDLRMGQHEWLHSSAVGKALSALLPDHEVVDLLTEAGLPRRTGRTLAGVQEVLEELGRVRDQGFAVDDEEDADGVVCVAAAARGRSGEPLLAVSVTGLAADLRGDRRVPVAEAVTATARGLERVLGGPVTGRPEVRGAGR